VNEFLRLLHEYQDITLTMDGMKRLSHGPTHKAKRMASSYPPIIVQPCKWQKPSPPREFLPIYPPPDLIDSPPPPLPTPRQAQFSRFFSLSTHIVPAVHLRQGPYIPIPDLSPILSKNEGIINQSLELQKNARDQGIKASKHENRLWNILNRYVNTSPTTTTSGTPTSNRLTLFFAPAGSLPKEVSFFFFARARVRVGVDVCSTAVLSFFQVSRRDLSSDEYCCCL